MFIVNPYIYATTSYLLDTYSAAAAYSLRQLKTGVTSVVRVRRSSDNAESDFTATEITDGTLTTWTGANNGFVVTWYDQSGNGKNATQSTAASQPQIVSSGALLTNSNGNPKLVFDGSDDTLVVTALIPSTSTDIWSFLTSYDSAGQYGIAKDAGVTWGWRHQGSTTSVLEQTGVESGAVYTATKTLVTGEKLSVSNYDRNAEIDVWINSSVGTSDIPNNSNLRGATGNVTIGAFAGATIARVETSEWILFLSDQSANRTSIELDINTYYSIY